MPTKQRYVTFSCYPLWATIQLRLVWAAIAGQYDCCGRWVRQKTRRSNL